MIGKTIGKYRILEKLGRGGMGTVYKAVDQTLGREVAIKVLRPEMADTDVVKRFEAEARALAALNQPEIAAIHEIQDTGTDLLIVTERVRGENIDELLRRAGMLPPERAAYLVVQILGALSQAHAAGVVHRNLKPSNVMVTETGGVKILDFAVARVAGVEQMTAVASMGGTPAYMSPERILGDEIDGRADLYSVGVLFYHLLTNALPFEAPSPAEMVERQLSAPPTPARRHRPDLPDWCEDVLSRALAKAPVDRFQSAEAFRSALLASIGSAASDQTGLYSTTAAARVIVAAPEPDEAPTTLTPAPTAIPPASPASGWSSADAATQLSSVPSTFLESDGSAPTVLVGAPMPPSEPTSTTPTLVMKRKQFAMAAALLGVLAIGVVVLAGIVLLRPDPVVVAPPTPTDGGGLGQSQGTPPAAESASPPPLEILDPPVLTAPREAPPSPPLASARPTVRRAPSVAPVLATVPSPVPAIAPSRVMNAAPLEFDAKAVVTDSGKHRERDAKVLIADGAVTISEKDTVLYKVPVATLTGLTYSNSKQPLWSSPAGPAEAMNVESGAFGFLKGGRNWFGLRTSDHLLVLRVDDNAVGRVITGLADRTGLPVTRLIEPK